MAVFNPLVCFMLTLAFFAILSGCNTTEKPNINSASAFTKVVDLKDDFVLLQSSLSTGTTEEKIKRWEQLIEEPNSHFYRHVIWQDLDEGWQQRRIEYLTTLLNKYSAKGVDYEASYLSGRLALEKGIAVFAEHFPEFNTPITAYLAPGVGWGGSVLLDIDGINYLPLGVDVFAEHSDSHFPASVVPHELFHAYQMAQSGVHASTADWEAKGKVYWHLWAEGLATYAVQKMFPQMPVEEYMVWPQYKGFILSCADRKALSSQFIEIFNQPAIPKPKAWFGGDSSALGEQFPPAIGYYLGSKVAEYISRENNMDTKQLSRLSYEDAEPFIKGALSSFSQQQCE